MDVDVAAVGVGVPAFFAFEPEDAGDDGIATGGVDGDDFAGRASAFEFHAHGLTGADFFGDFESAQGGAVGAGDVTEGEAGGGDGEGGEELLLFEDGHALFGDGDDDAVAAVGAGGEQSEAGGQEEEGGSGDERHGTV